MASITSTFLKEIKRYTEGTSIPPLDLQLLNSTGTVLGSGTVTIGALANGTSAGSYQITINGVDDGQITNDTLTTPTATSKFKIIERSSKVELISGELQTARQVMKGDSFTTGPSTITFTIS